MSTNKSTIAIILLVFSFAFTGCKNGNKEVYTEKELPALITILDSLGRDFANQGSMAALKQKLALMTNSPSEEVVSAALERYNSLDEDAIFLDSLEKEVLARFPKGLKARSLERDKVYESQTADEKALTFKHWIENFPPSAFPRKHQDIYDETRLHIIETYITEDRPKEAGALAENFLLKDKLPWYYYSIAGLYHNVDKPNDAKEYLNKAMLNAEDLLKSPHLDQENREIIEQQLRDIHNFYANLYFEEAQYDKALVHFKNIEAQLGSYEDQEVLRYVTVLDTLGKADAAFGVVENRLFHGYISEELPKWHKKLFLRTKGNTADYGAYRAALDLRISEAKRKKIKEALVDLPAPKVLLHGVDGTVTPLDTFLGDIVVMDFWALWCGPCIDSFPAMQEVKEQYQEQGGVRFLFVNTMELTQGEERIEGVNKLMKEKGYDFQVYVDQPTTDGSNYQFAEAFEIQGIPLKIIIDANGRVRYHSLGYQGTTAKEIEHMKAIIDIVKAL